MVKGDRQGGGKCCWDLGYLTYKGLASKYNLMCYIPFLNTIFTKLDVGALKDRHV